MLKLDSEWIYCVCQNQAAGAYSYLYFFIFLSLLCPNVEILSHFSQLNETKTFNQCNTDD